MKKKEGVSIKKLNFQIVSNIALIIASVILGIILCFDAFKMNGELKALRKEYNEYKKSAEEQITLLSDKLNSLSDEYDDLSELTVNELLEYIEPLKELDKQEYMNQYKKIVEKYGTSEEKGLSLYDEYSEEQINIMCRCIETEVYQCSFDAKVNIANVIFNRIKDNKFPSDPYSVITAKNQFAYHRTKISEDTLLALEYAYIHGDTTNQAIAFRSDCGNETWGGWKLCHYDGYHWFYNYEGRSL